ncbi:hypothetical protein BGZ73_007932, partial [Actinomortierella ambigua]
MNIPLNGTQAAASHYSRSRIWARWSSKRSGCSEADTVSLDGWFAMAEAASIDAMMHLLDYECGLADLLELDMIADKTLAWLKRRGLDNDTLATVIA